MKVKKAIRHHLEYHYANSQRNTCRCGEFVYIPSKLQRRLGDYVRDNKIRPDERIFPVSYIIMVDG